MAHECGCHAHAPSTTRGADATVTPDMTVGDVMQHDAATLDALSRPAAAKA